MTVPAITLRSVSPADAALLYRIYASTREDELALAGWTEAMIKPFLDLQFRARQAGYANAFAGAGSFIVEVGGEPAGRLLVDRRGRVVHVADIALLGAYRGRGVGTALLRSLLDEAREQRTDVTLSVEISNRAGALYARLGFVETAVHGLYRQLRFRAANAPAAAPERNLQDMLA